MLTMGGIPIKFGVLTSVRSQLYVVTLQITTLTIGVVKQNRKYRNGKMHSAGTRTPLFSRCCGLPCMQFPIWWLPQQLQQWIRIFLPFGQWDQLQRRWRVYRERQFKTSLVARRFVRRVHASPGCISHTSSRGC